MNDQLWAPWRLQYIVTAKTEDQAGDDCFLCRYRDDSRDDDNLVVDRSRHSLIVLNRYPYNNGHLLVAPLNHKASLEELDEDELCDGVRQLRRMTTLYRRLLNPDGFNIGINLGRVAGAGLPGHVHWHVVPRWNGDTNFMPVLGGVNVISQSLSALLELIRAEMNGGNSE